MHRLNTLCVLLSLICVCSQHSWARSRNYKPEQFAEETVQPGKFVFLKLKHQQQKYYMCGPTSASMIVSYFGGDCSPELIAAMASRDSERAKGTADGDLIQALNRLGYAWRKPIFTKSAVLSQVKDQLDRRFPIYFVFAAKESMHAVVVVGYDNESIFCLDPNTDNNTPYLGARIIPIKDLESARNISYKHSYWWFTGPEVAGEYTVSDEEPYSYENLSLEELEKLYTEERQAGVNTNLDKVEMLQGYIYRLKKPTKLKGAQLYEGLSLKELQKLFREEYRKSKKYTEKMKILSSCINYLKYQKYVEEQRGPFSPYIDLSLAELQKMYSKEFKKGKKRNYEKLNTISKYIGRRRKLGPPAGTQASVILETETEKLVLMDKLYQSLSKEGNWSQKESIDHFLSSENISFLSIELIRDDQVKNLGGVTGFTRDYFGDALKFVESRKRMPFIVSDKYLVCFHSKPAKRNRITITLYDRKEKLGVQHILPTQLSKYVITRGQKEHQLTLFGL